MGKRSMNARQRRFVEEYLKDLNGSEAARRAGYSAVSAHVHSNRLMRDPAIKAAIDAELGKRSKRTQITADRVLIELARIAFANIADFATFDADHVTLTDSATLGRHRLAAVAEVTQTTTRDGVNVKIKMHDKLAALEKIGRHLGMWKESEDKNANAVERFKSALAEIMQSGSLHK